MKIYYYFVWADDPLYLTSLHMFNEYAQAIGAKGITVPSMGYFRQEQGTHKLHVFRLSPTYEITHHVPSRNEDFMQRVEISDYVVDMAKIVQEYI